jgi:alpha/beta superfamily hydrolase
MSDVVVESCTVRTADGLLLEAELAAPDAAPRAAMVLCHPHPQYGGTMRSIVIGALFDALPRTAVTCLRFNFRGVENSEGVHAGGEQEELDALAAIEALDHAVAPDVPLLLTGWSFGADIALSTVHPRLAAWIAIAPPLRNVHDFSAIAADERPKLLALAEHDEYRDPSSVIAETASWANTETVIVGGASHYFIGRTNRLVELTTGYVDRVVAD